MPQIAAYHKKLFEGTNHKLKLLILIRKTILLAWKSAPRVDTTYTHLSLVDIEIGVAILLKTLCKLAIVLGVNIELIRCIRECICLEESLANNLETTTSSVGYSPPTEVAMRATLLRTSVEWPELVMNALLVDAYKSSTRAVNICLMLACAIKYRMMEDVEYDKFIGCVKATLGIKKLAEKNDIDCYVYNDIDQATFRTAGCRAGFYPQWFNENVSVLVPEADIGAGLITYILKLMSGRNVNFVEPFHIEDDFGTFAGGHAGPNDHNDPDWQENVIISRDVRFAKTSWKYAGAPFAWYRFSPGMKTVAGLYEEDGKYKLITFMAESLSEKDTPQSDKKHLLATYSHTIFRPVVPAKELWEQVLRIGATQHYAIVDGDWRKELEDFAEIMGFEFYSIK